MYNCKYCCKECKNANSLRNHERLCKSNPDRQLTPYEKGIKTFELSGRVKTSRKISGQDFQSEEFDRQCPYCKRWFGSSQIGGHTSWCNKAPEKDERFVLTYSGILSNITNKQLDEYRKKHPTCEICGRPVDEVTKYTGKFAVTKLCIDHNHETGEFRGLLCQPCNRQLGWYEKNKDSINDYLNKTLEL